MNQTGPLKDRVIRIWPQALWLRLLIVVVPLAVLGAFIWTYRRAGAVEYYTARVERGSVSQVVQATGTINAVVSVQVGSQVSGNIQKLNVDFNSRVKNGQVIAQIEPSVFQAKMMQAQADVQTAQANVKALEANIQTQKADLAVSRANVEKAKAQLFDAKTQADRTDQLASTGVLAPQQRDTANANFSAAKAEVDAAEANVEESQAKFDSMVAQRDQAIAQVALKRAALASAQLDLDHTTIFAPIDGTVIARNVDVGQTVAASLSAPTLFVIAQDLTKMLVYAKTDEADVGRIQVGAEATFRVDSFPRETFSGHVQQVRMNPSTVQNVVTYDTIIAFDNPGQRLFPGMTAYVAIPVAWENDVVKIPNGALRFKPNMPDSDRDALYAKYNIPLDNAPAGGRAGRGAAGGNGSAAIAPDAAQAGGAGRRGGGGGGNGRGQRRQQPADDTTTATNGRGGTGANASGARNDWGVVWKELPDHTLRPIRVRQGVTDFTYTALEEGDLKVGDQLIIGEISTATASAQQGTPAPGLGGRGGVGGGFGGGFRPGVGR